MPLKKPLRIAVVAGARPNFMKVAPLMEAMRKKPKIFKPLLVHTGQHYDEPMSAAFLKDLHLTAPKFSLRIGSGSHAQQTAKAMIAFESVCLQKRPSLVVVVGDVNSTLACSLVATKMGIPLAHVEAGLRSFDRGMPEEINRIVTDHLSQYLFAPFQGAVDNLRQEGIPGEGIYLVGNVMIDTLLRYKGEAIPRRAWERFDLEPNAYGVVTLHRPSNVDCPEILGTILKALSQIQRELPLVFPIHPRTHRSVRRFGLRRMLTRAPRLMVIPPMGYLDFLSLMSRARLVLTDSGGIQEETTVLGIPCLTLREKTERPITIAMGTNEMVYPGGDLVTQTKKILSRGGKRGLIPPLWDGKASERIASILADKLG